MALPTGFSITKVLIEPVYTDSANDKTRKRYEAEHSTPAIVIDTDLTLIDAALTAVSDSTINTYMVTFEIKKTAVLPALGGTENENIAVLDIGLTDPDKSARLVIPGATAGIFIDTEGEGRNNVDTADTDVQAFVGLFQIGGDNLLKLSDGEHANDTMALALRAGVRSKGKPHKARTKRKG